MIQMISPASAGLPAGGPAPARFAAQDETSFPLAEAAAEEAHSAHFVGVLLLAQRESVGPEDGTEDGVCTGAVPPVAEAEAGPPGERRKPEDAVPAQLAGAGRTPWTMYLPDPEAVPGEGGAVAAGTDDPGQGAQPAGLQPASGGEHAVAGEMATPEGTRPDAETAAGIAESAEAHQSPVATAGGRTSVPAGQVVSAEPKHPEPDDAEARGLRPQIRPETRTQAAGGAGERGRPAEGAATGAHPLGATRDRFPSTGRVQTAGEVAPGDADGPVARNVTPNPVPTNGPETGRSAAGGTGATTDHATARGRMRAERRAAAGASQAGRETNPAASDESDGPPVLKGQSSPAGPGIVRAAQASGNNGGVSRTQAPEDAPEPAGGSGLVASVRRGASGTAGLPEAGAQTGPGSVALLEPDAAGGRETAPVHDDTVVRESAFPEAPEGGAQDLPSQIAARARLLRRSGGAGTLEVRLRPASLGRVFMRLASEAGGRVDVILRAERLEVAEAMRNDAARLVEALKAQGLSVGSIEIGRSAGSAPGGDHGSSAGGTGTPGTGAEGLDAGGNGPWAGGAEARAGDRGEVLSRAYGRLAAGTPAGAAEVIPSPAAGGAGWGTGRWVNLFA